MIKAAKWQIDGQFRRPFYDTSAVIADNRCTGWVVDINSLPSECMTNTQSSPFELEVFFDGGCPLCLREINLLRRWDRKGRIRFTDIDQPDFQPESLGKTYDELMSRIYARDSEGHWFSGVEVFRRLYTAVGLRPLVILSRLPVISQMLELGYIIFAKNRLRLTGRCDTKTCAINRNLTTSTKDSA